MAEKGQEMSAAEKRAKKKYNAKPEQKKARARRNRDRRRAIREGKVKNSGKAGGGGGKDIDHPTKYARGKPRVRSTSENRRDNRR